MLTAEQDAAGDAGSQKDRKVVSCAECRRSKLKCDRVFPCQSCIRRGCASICPDGTQVATKGNKFLATYVQRLTSQVNTMSARIKQLEYALMQAQRSGQCGSPPRHEPLDFTEFEAIHSNGLDDVSGAVGSLSIGLDGKAKYHGETAGSEYFQELLKSPDKEEPWRPRDPRNLGFPFEIVELVNSFPFGLRDCPYTKALFLQFLPSRSRALELADLYYQNVAWMYEPVVRDDFMATIIEPMYGTNSTAKVSDIHSHRLSTFFILLASGIVFDANPCAMILAEQYHSLARGALALNSILQEATCATVQALFLMCHFIYTSDRASGEARWLLFGLCTRVAHVIGLSRDSARWPLDPQEVQRRRLMFWDLYTYDSWGSLLNGRPPSLFINHADCCFPEDLDQVKGPDGLIEPSFHAWKHQYSVSCLSISVQHVFTIKSPLYSALTELDRKIRQFPTPSHLQAPMQSSEAGRTWSNDPLRATQQYCALSMRESNLLYIHRSFFTEAIRAQPQEPLKHKFAPSVLATYRSANRMILSLEGVYALHPEQISRVWFFWSGIFSSCVVLGGLIIESPACELAPDALRDLELGLALFEEGSAPCRPAATLNMLQKLKQRAVTAFNMYRAGFPNRFISTREDAVDELEVLGGRKSLVNQSSLNSPHLSSDTAAFSPCSNVPGEARGNEEMPASLAQTPGLAEYYDSIPYPLIGTAFGTEDRHDMYSPQVVHNDVPFTMQSGQMQYEQVQTSQFTQPTKPSYLNYSR